MNFSFAIQEKKVVKNAKRGLGETKEEYVSLSSTLAETKEEYVSLSSILA